MPVKDLMPLNDTLMTVLLCNQIFGVTQEVLEDLAVVEGVQSTLVEGVQST